MELNEVSKHKAENLSRKPQQKVIKELSEATADGEKSTERKCSSQIMMNKRRIRKLLFMFITWICIEY